MQRILIMVSYVHLDNLPDTSNHLLNILWDRNHGMSLAELTDAVNKEFYLHWEKEDVKKFLQLLVAKGYAKTIRCGLKKHYIALGADLL